MVKTSSESEGGSHGEEIVTVGIDSGDLNIVLGGWSDGWDIEWEGLAPDGSWDDIYDGWHELLIVDLGAEEPASELKVCNGKRVGGESGDGELLGSAECGGIWGALSLVHDDGEVVLSGVLFEGHWGGEGWECSGSLEGSVWSEFVGGNSGGESECLEHSFVQVTCSLLVRVEELCLWDDNIITILVIHVLTELVQLLLEIQVLLLVVTFTSEVFF
jgi:hypothetical protein